MVLIYFSFLSRLYGFEGLGELLRVHTATYALLNIETLEETMNKKLWKENIFGTINEQLYRIASFRTNVNNFAMEAASRAFDISIRALYPDIPGRTKKHYVNWCTSQHNFDPLEPKMDVPIMWTIDAPSTEKTLLFNHFVPLFFKTDFPDASKLPCGMPTDDAGQVTEQPSSADEIEILEKSNDSGDIKILEQSKVSDDVEVIEPATKSTEQSSVKDKIKMQSDLLKKTSVPSTVGLPTQEIKEGKIKSELDATSVMQDTTQKEANWKLLNKRKCIHGGKNFDKTGESLPLSHVVREMLQRHVFDEIPNGDKSYTRLVYRNKYNQDIFDGISKEKQFDYTDDTSTNSKMTPKLLVYSIDSSGLMTSLGRKLSLKNGLWYNNKELLQPQPTPDNSITFRLVYHWKDEPYRFRRRTVEVFRAPTKFQQLVGLAYVEYLGIFSVVSKFEFLFCFLMELGILGCWP